MPVEVTAVLKKKCGVYVSGETVECTVTLYNKNDPSNGPVETIAWCSAQILCQEVVNSRKVNKIRSVASLTQNDIASRGTSFLPSRGECGSTVYSSKPLILGCDIQLLPGQTKILQYEDSLPLEGIPPSYKGVALKYQYKLTIGVQHVDCTVKLLRIPIRISTLEGLCALCQDKDAADRSNPFQPMDSQHLSTVDITNDVLDALTTVKNPHVYNVVMDNERVCRVSLKKKSFRLGENIPVKLNFDECDVTCYKYHISLQTTETIAEEYRVKGSEGVYATTIYSRHDLCCAYNAVEILLQVPLGATASFFNELVKVQWKLHFEFVIHMAASAEKRTPCDADLVWTAPTQVNVKTISWDLPIKVFPCSSVQAECNCLTAYPTAGFLLIE